MIVFWNKNLDFTTNTNLKKEINKQTFATFL